MPTFEEQYLSKILSIKYKRKLFLNELYGGLWLGGF